MFAENLRMTEHGIIENIVFFFCVCLRLLNNASVSFSFFLSMTAVKGKFIVWKEENASEILRFSEFAKVVVDIPVNCKHSETRKAHDSVT